MRFSRSRPADIVAIVDDGGPGCDVSGQFCVAFCNLPVRMPGMRRCENPEVKCGQPTESDKSENFFTTIDAVELAHDDFPVKLVANTFQATGIEWRPV